MNYCPLGEDGVGGEGSRCAHAHEVGTAEITADEHDLDTDNHGPTSDLPTASNVRTTTDLDAVEEDSNREVAKSIATLAGNVLEWYDFAVFGYFSDVIGAVFFPPHQKGHSSIVEAFVVFGGAFLMRPLGGVLLGHVGDTYGRKKALEVSVFCMAVATFVMGCLPSFRQAGKWAIVGLALTRLLQGLSVGGQMISSTVYYCELHPPSAWGFYGSHVHMSSSFGAVVGGMVGALLRQVLTQSELESWGWRIPFWSGCLVALSGFYLHYACEEDQVERRHSDDDRPPLWRAFALKNLRSLAAATLVSMVSAAAFYLYFVWMATFMNNLVNPPVPHAFVVNSVALLFCILCLPMGGALSDKFGRVPTMTIAGLLMAVLTYPMMSVIDRAKGGMWTACLAQSVLGLSLALWNGPVGAWLVERFEPEVRMTSVAIGYNTAQALLGGFSPAIATVLVDKVGPHAPALYILFICALALTGLWWVAPQKSSQSSSTVREVEISIEEVPTDALRSPLLPSDGDDTPGENEDFQEEAS